VFYNYVYLDIGQAYEYIIFNLHLNRQVCHV